MMLLRQGLALAAVLWGMGMSTAAMAELVPAELKCEYRQNPLGIDVARPRLSWVLTSPDRGQRQTAYQILAAGSGDALAEDRADLWDSGKVDSEESVHIEYAGKDLHSGQRVYWKVRVWDRDGRADAYSPSAWWEMGLLKPEDWRANWIMRDEPMMTADEDFYAERPNPLFRKEFQVRAPVRRARAYATGLGYYELSLNGTKVGDHVLDPAWTSYSKRILYATYDVTGMLREGVNCAGVMLGNGWYNPLPLRLWGRINLREALTVGRPMTIVQIEIEYTDGSHERVVTDPTWKAGDGPIVQNSVYLGEVYDAEREQGGWDSPGFDESSWMPAMIAPVGVEVLRAQSQPPIKVVGGFKPVKITEPSPGAFVYDLGQNFAGRARLRVQGPAGTRVTMRHGELLNPDGTLNVMTSVAGQIKQEGMGGPGAPPLACQSDTYVLKGGGLEEYAPHFTFHGFRYIEVTGFPGKPGPEALEGEVLSASVGLVGTFFCSSELANGIQDMVEWTQLSNMFGVQSDCPHREKFGYGGDIAVSSEMAMLNFDMSTFYEKAAHDLADDARPGGGITETAPYVGIADESLGDQAGPIGWGTAQPLLQCQLYQYYGNRRLMEEQYETTRRWIAFLQAGAKDHIIDKGISDHESLAPKPVELSSTAFYYYNVMLASKIANVLNRSEDAAKYAALAGQIKRAFNAKFADPRTGRYAIATQAAQAFALYMDLVPAELREKALAVLIDDIQETHKGHLSTGIFGTKYMLNTLTDMGRADVAWTIVSQQDFPGWGHMLEHGATTLWEHWEYSDNVYSHNHPMFGSVSEWFHKTIAGINPAPDAVGFDRVIVRPHVVGDLTWATGMHNSIRGKLVSSWKVENGTFKLDLTIPTGVSAEVQLPVGEASKVTEGGKPVEQAEGVRFLRLAKDRAVYTIGGGEYKFVVSGFVQ